MQVRIDDAMQSGHPHDTIIDVRSPGEFALDHIPGAINLPVLSDDERVLVGTLNAREGAFTAKRTGAALVSRNIGRLLQEQLADKPPSWRPLVYCWRGGNRSGSLATVLARIGWRCAVLEGGYRSYRRWVVSTLETLAPTLQWRVVAGRTGTGKSRILEALQSGGHQSLDLEALANHRGSVLGLLPDARQPTQKWFESSLLAVMRRFDPSRPVHVESESRKIGQIQVPEGLIGAMRAAPCIVVERSLAARARFLIDDYAHFLDDPALLSMLLGKLRDLHGHRKLGEWQALIDAGAWTDLVTRLLAEHYDPAYDRSIRKNFSDLRQAIRVSTDDLAPGDDDHDRWFEHAARQIGGIGLNT